MDPGLRAARGGSSEAVPGQSRFLQELASAAGVENAPEGAKGRGGDDSPEQAVHTGAKRGSPRARESRQASLANGKVQTDPAAKCDSPVPLWRERGRSSSETGQEDE